MADDNLAAELERVKQRHFWALAPRAGSATVRASLDDNPLLVAAVEAVLKRHVQVEKLTRLGPPAFRKCAECDQIWPCNTFEDITAALTGKELDNG